MIAFFTKKFIYTKNKNVKKMGKLTNYCKENPITILLIVGIIGVIIFYTALIIVGIHTTN